MCLSIALLLLFFPDVAYAAGGVASLPLETAVKTLLKIVKIFVAASAMFSAASLTYKLMMGQKEAIPKTVISLIAFTGGVILLDQISKLTVSANVADNSSMSAVIGDSISILLCGVAIINIGKAVAKMVQGGDGSFHKLAMTTFAAIAGIVVIKAVIAHRSGVLI